jgi:Domain of unknown function (DUF6602)
MDVRLLFYNASKKLMVDFETSAQSATHMGGRGSLREDAFINFLRAHLPQKYKVGRGEVFTSENQSSGQLDVILYDEQNCPSFLQAESHGAFPIEAVYGAISVKSDLTSGELKDAYLNIASLKRITPKNPVWHPRNQGFRTAANSPTPVTGVFAYRASRSLEAVQKQVQTLDQELDDISLRPDFVAIAEVGFVGPAIPLRGSLNKFHLPMAEDLGSLHKSGRSTIFVLMMNLYRELRTIILNPFDFLEYRNMPKLVGKHRVEHGDIVRDGTRIIFVNERGVELLLEKSKQVTIRDVELHRFGTLTGLVPPELLDQVVYEYNPLNLPPFAEIAQENGLTVGKSSSGGPCFVPMK